MSISVHKTQLLQDEPVVLSIRLNNPTASKIAVALTQRPWDPLIKFTIQDTSGKAPTRVLASQRDVASEYQWGGLPDNIRITTTQTYPTTVLHPNTAVTYRKRYRFDRPGRYDIQAHLPEIRDLGQAALTSNRVAVEVTEPPDAEKKARDLSTHESTRLLRSDRHEGVQPLRRLIREFPTSVYSDDARYTLGKFYMELGEYDESVRMFQDLLNVRPDSPLGVEVRYYIARANYLRGVKAFQDLIGQHPNWIGSHRAQSVLLHGIDP